MASRFANFYFMFAWCLDPWIGRWRPYFWDVSVNVATPRHTVVIFTNKVYLYNWYNINQNGKEIISNLSNNSYIVPGLAFGCYVGEVEKIADELIIAAAESLAELVEDDYLEKR